MMKYGLKWMLLAAAGILLSAQRSEAQTYVKLNGCLLYTSGSFPADGYHGYAKSDGQQNDLKHGRIVAGRTDDVFRNHIH